MTQLPPSPDLSPAKEISSPKSLSLDKIENNRAVPRLRSIAKYQPFRPQAIACSAPTCSYFSEESEVEAPRFIGHQSSQRYKDASSSLGAIAGRNGVALFRMSRPQTPLLILSHASSTNSELGSIRTLAFEPKLQHALLLAAARGSGVLIWDASGHSLSPLLGRLGANVTANDSSEASIKSLVWIESSSYPLLAVANAANVSVWDLRSCLGSKSGRPSIRFGTSQADASPLLQVASAKNEECATLDASGVVRVYDMRIAGTRNKGMTRSICTFPAHQYGGVGLTSTIGANHETNWITWGLDAPHAGAIVKIWTTAATAHQESFINSADDEYWFMDGSASERSPLDISRVGSPNRVASAVHLVAQFTTPGLACARVCPDIFDDLKSHIVTVSIESNEEHMGWRADVWKLNSSDDDSSDVTPNICVKNVLSCRSGTVEAHLSSTVGNINTGALIGAELAVAMPQAKHHDKDIDENQREMLLCCLTDSGFVTTTTLMSTTLRATMENNTINGESWRKTGPTGTVYLSDTLENVFSDAAIAMRSFGEKPRQSFIVGLDESFSGGFLDLSPQLMASEREVDIIMQETHPSTRSVEIGGMQFDLDDPAIIKAGVGPINAINSVSGSILPGTRSVETITDKIQKTAAIMNKINIREIPCPRLCGASFSPGIGGLICFQNGEVKKMWSWYQQSGKRRSSIMGMSFLQTKESKPYEAANKVDTEDSSQNVPRTLKDLIDMTEASKKAQWGQEEDSGGADATGSDGSLDDLLGDDETTEDGDADSEENGDFFDKYLGGIQKPIAVPSLSPKGKADPSARSLDMKDKISASTSENRLDGPTTDLLSPIVSVSHANDIFFNGQTPQLAERLLLSDWFAPPFQKTAQETSFSFPDRNRYQTNIDSSTSRSQTSFRSIMPKSQRSQFSPEPGPLGPNGLSRSIPLLVNSQMDDSVVGEEAVHGGEYSVRPSRQESLVFLKKLFSHQQDGPSYQNIVSPPDAPMLPKTIKKNSSLNAMMQGSVTNFSADSYIEETKRVSVVVLNPEKETKERQEYLEQLLGKMKGTCVHNSNVCRDLGQEDKANVWSLLAETIENQATDEVGSFSGWGGSSGGSLGQDLVVNLLNYYESEGDVQMLSTMVCVLSGGQRKVVDSKRDASLLLPTSFNSKFDIAMRRYSEILYSWDLLTVRAEVMKHIVHQMPFCSFFEGSPNLVDEGADTPGIGTAIRCSKCDGSATPGTNVCSSCHDFAFRCSICDCAVRGLFTFCEKCGHGGHMNHMTDWFSKKSSCPTGCGCFCAMSPSGSNPSTPVPVLSV